MMNAILLIDNAINQLILKYDIVDDKDRAVIENIITDLTISKNNINKLLG